MRILENGFRRSLRHDCAARTSGSRPHIDYPIGRSNHIGIVLDNQNGISGIDQIAQNF